MEVKKIVDTQRRFFLTDKTRSVEFRKKALGRLFRGIQQNEERLIHALYEDLGKSATESYMTELSIVYSEIKHALKHLDQWCRPRRVSSSLATLPAKNYVLMEPYGVALILSPWNYPVNLALAPLVGAIAAGNCVVVKPSKSSIHTSELLRDILNELFPPEYIYCTDPAEQYEEVTKQRYDYIFFTGSPRVGKQIMREASEYLTPVSLELGGKSPCIIEEHANLKIAAKRIAWGKFLNAGQTCISIDYVLVDNRVREAFIRELCSELACRYADAQNRDDYPRIISQHHYDRLCGLIDRAENVMGGERNPDKCKIAPAIIPNADFSQEIMEEEIFGPILPVIGYDNLTEMVHKVRELEKPLACYIFSENRKVADWIASEISFGGGCINDVLLHVAGHGLPFGGVGNSGMGQYHGKYSFETFSHRKAVVKNSTKMDVPFRYAPFDEAKLKLLRKLL